MAYFSQARKLKQEAINTYKLDVESERAELERMREEARAMALENAEQVIEAVEANCRAEVGALQEQHASALAAMELQLQEQLGRERRTMEEEIESRGRIVAVQVTELKAAHAQQLADMKASMTRAPSKPRP